MPIYNVVLKKIILQLWFIYSRTYSGKGFLASTPALNIYFIFFPALRGMVSLKFQYKKFSKLFQNFFRWDKRYENFFFLLRGPTHCSFTFYSPFLYELKHICLNKIVFGFPFLIPFGFLVKFIFLFNIKHGLFDFKRHNSFQNKHRKATHNFAPGPLIFK